MKKAFTFIAASALILCSAGCRKQELQQNEFGGQTLNLTLEATRGDVPDTKTTISYNEEYASLESVWKTGDKIYVYSRKSGAKIGELTQTGDIVNQKTSATAQYSTSYAKFIGSVTLGAGDAITDDYAFVYQGEGRALVVSEGKLTYEIETKPNIADLSIWDLAYATGKIQGNAASASCAVSFSNKLAFGYFTTKGLTDTGLSAQYFSGFTFDVKTGTVTGTRGSVSLPNQQEFYMPLIPGEVNMDCGKTWSQNDQQGNKWGYTTTKQSKSFTAAAGSYYRLGRSSSFGPVAFIKTDWTLYETLKGSKFKVAADKEVYFTQGNLQYIGSAVDASGDPAPYWRVAPDQYSYLGANQGCPTSVDAGSTIPANTDVDLFGWGDVTPPFKGSTVNSDYRPLVTPNYNYVNNYHLTNDWAKNFNGESPTERLYAEYDRVYPNTVGNYYCLSMEEWKYLFDNQWWGFASVTLNDNTVCKGIVICPNNINSEALAKNYLPNVIYKSHDDQSGKSDSFSENFINQSTIDDNGLLFLPATGYRSGVNFVGRGSFIEYWTTTSANEYDDAYRIEADSQKFTIGSYQGRFSGRAVRLAIVSSSNE